MFKQRRAPRKVGSDNYEGEDSLGLQVVVKPRRRAIAADDEVNEEVQVHKRGRKPRLAVHRSDVRRAEATTRNIGKEEQGSESVHNFKTTDAPDPENQLDLTAKFGSSLARYEQPCIIPSAAEIAEKKARRARLAKEKAAEYIPLDEGDSDAEEDERGRLILRAKEKTTEGRLIREDEDIFEGFDEFTEADKIILGRERDETKRRKEDVAARLAEMEEAESSNESEEEENAAFEAAQTRHGTYATAKAPTETTKQHTPPIITPLPTLKGVLERLGKKLEEMRADQAHRVQEMEALKAERMRLAEEEVKIQKALDETAEKFEELRVEKGVEAEAKQDLCVAEKSRDSEDVEAEEVDDFAVVQGHAGLGYG
ncbi:hypothetical protein K470DRAFT_292900 [Piedraia hortae CBS 480.64]|uniref:Nineteen complex-related protein 2-domain-containing protein n=1 Tax=Piedraia hortae CBS 480.64 TaxID=1314780 RepID=A0A6A7C8B1_9PEZI|nr:hypothetical protein K470DRAFT_292900 [Piedraia hortae CBS 480.64]